MKTVSRDDRIVNSRDRATSILRGMGIDRTQYDRYIDRMPENRFNVKLSLIYSQRTLASAGSPRISVQTAVQPTVQSTVQSTVQPTKPSIASICLTVFKRHGSNADAWAAVKSAIEIDDSKKWYAGWYRGHFKRLGKL